MNIDDLVGSATNWRGSIRTKSKMEFVMGNESPTPRRRLAPRKVAFAACHVGNTKGHELINRGLIKAVKLHGKTLVDMDSVDAFLATLPEA